MTSTTEGKKQRRLGTDLFAYATPLVLDPNFARECYSALTRVQWRQKTDRTNLYEASYKDAATALALIRNEKRGVDRSLINRKEAEDLGLYVRERKIIGEDAARRIEGRDIIYLDELGLSDVICLCLCNHSRNAHKDGVGQCAVQMRTKVTEDNGEVVEKVEPCHCGTYFGPEDYHDILSCAKQGEISDRVLKAFAKLGWEPAPPGTGFSQLRGVLSHPVSFSVFKQHTEKEFSEENTLFMEVLTAYKQWDMKKESIEAKLAEAKTIFATYIEDNGKSQLNLPNWNVNKCRQEVGVIESLVTQAASSSPSSPTATSKKRLSRKKSEKTKKSEKLPIYEPDFSPIVPEIAPGCGMMPAINHRLFVIPQPLEERLYHLFDEAEDEIFQLLKADTFTRFVKAECYEDLLKRKASGKMKMKKERKGHGSCTIL